jgi:hypothetical protein
MVAVVVPVGRDKGAGQSHAFLSVRVLLSRVKSLISLCYNCGLQH